MNEQPVRRTPCSLNADANEVEAMLGTIAQRLREVTVRPNAGARERQRRDELMGAHHYLPFRAHGGAAYDTSRCWASAGSRWSAGKPARSSCGPAMSGLGGCPSGSSSACI